MTSAVVTRTSDATATVQSGIREGDLAIHRTKIKRANSGESTTISGRRKVLQMRQTTFMRRLSQQARSLRHDKLERAPAHDREQGVVEGEEREVLARRVRHAGADGADDDRNREREEQERE